MCLHHHSWRVGKKVPPSDATTTFLLAEALKTLKLTGEKGASKVGKLLSAHNKMAGRAKRRMRNEHDPVAPPAKTGPKQREKTGPFFPPLFPGNAPPPPLHPPEECGGFWAQPTTILALILAAYRRD